MKIEKNIPIKNKPFVTEFLETIQKMEIGDSFKFPKSKYSSVRMAFKQYMLKANGSNFITREESETERRVWRTR